MNASHTLESATCSEIAAHNLGSSPQPFLCVLARSLLLNLAGLCGLADNVGFLQLAPRVNSTEDCQCRICSNVISIKLALCNVRATSMHLHL